MRIKRSMLEALAESLAETEAKEFEVSLTNGPSRAPKLNVSAIETREVEIPLALTPQGRALKKRAAERV